jgi:uncharacterized membrane protein (UPF0136 family)
MLAFLFVVVALLFRWLNVSGLPIHLLNFTPVAAALLFFGARQPRTRIWIPVGLLALSDVLLNLHYGYKFTPDFFVTIAWYAAIALLGSALLNKDSKPLRIGAASLLASVSFFVISNFMVWMVWDMYSKSFSGLLTCYAAALPFFRNTVTGDLVFSAAFFGIAYLVKAHASDKADHTAAA